MPVRFRVVRQHKATKTTASTDHLFALSRVIPGSTGIVINVVSDYISGMRSNTHVYAFVDMFAKSLQPLSFGDKDCSTLDYWAGNIHIV